MAAFHPNIGQPGGVLTSPKAVGHQLAVDRL